MDDLEYDFTTNTNDTDKETGDTTDKAMAKRKHNTYLFNTFVFLQVFNEINCRKVGAQDYNVFEKWYHNYYFLFVVIGTCVAQYIFCDWFSGIMKTVELTK